MKFLINAISNIINGSANAVFALVLPPLLISELTLDEYALWSYCLQTGALIGYLNLGVQTAVGRYVALYVEDNNNDSIIKVIKTADKILYSMFFLGLLVSMFFFLNIESLVNISQPDLKVLAPQVIFIVSLGYCFSLLLNSYSGYFVGVRRNHVPMWVNLISKIILGILVVYYANEGLLFLSIIFLVVNICTYFLSFLLWKREAVNQYVLLSKTYIEKNAFIKFCLGLSVWNLGMLLVTGINTTIVGYFSFQHVAYFTIANGLVMAVIGFASTGLNPLIQVFTGMHVKKQSDSIAKIIIAANNGLSVLMLTAFVFYHLFSESFFTFWLNQDYSLPVAQFVDLLIISACFRVLNVPYALALIATGNQSKALLGALFEGVSNIILAVIFCSYYDVNALPYAMILSSVIGSIYNVFVNFNLMKVDIPVYRLQLFSVELVCLLLSITSYWFTPLLSYMMLFVCISYSLLYKRWLFNFIKGKVNV